MISSLKFDFAVMTRGYSRRNDFQWKASWLEQNDDVSDHPIRQRLKDVGLKDLLDGQVPGIAVSKNGHAFSLILTDIPTDYHSPVAPGKIRVCFAFFDITESDARAIVASFLGDWMNTVKELEKSIVRGTKDPEWYFQIDYIESWIRRLRGRPEENSISNPLRRIIYERPENGGFTPFVDHAVAKVFSDRDGLKVAIGHVLNTDAQDRVEHADFAALPYFTQPNVLQEPERTSKSPNGNTIAAALAIGGVILLGFFFGKKSHPETSRVSAPYPELQLNLYSAVRAAPQIRDFTLNQKFKDQLLAFRIATADELHLQTSEGRTLSREILNHWLERFKTIGPVVDSEAAAQSRDRIAASLLESLNQLGSLSTSAAENTLSENTRIQKIEGQFREDLLIPTEEIASWRDGNGQLDLSKVHLKIAIFSSGKWPNASALEILKSLK